MASRGEVEQAVVRMKLVGSGQPRNETGAEKLPGVSNYFIGNDPAKWRTDVPHYARVQYERVYPGIDLVWYGNQSRLEYDFVVGPGADPKQIQVAYEGVESLRMESTATLSYGWPQARCGSRSRRSIRRLAATRRDRRSSRCTTTTSTRPLRATASNRCLAGRFKLEPDSPSPSKRSSSRRYAGRPADVRSPSVFTDCLV